MSDVSIGTAVCPDPLSVLLPSADSHTPEEIPDFTFPTLVVECGSEVASRCFDDTKHPGGVVHVEGLPRISGSEVSLRNHG